MVEWYVYVACGCCVLECEGSLARSRRVIGKEYASARNLALALALAAFDTMHIN